MSRTLSAVPVVTLAQYERAGGGRGLAAARDLDPEALISRIERSGLRAHGGSGVACGPKWRTVLAYATGAATKPSVIVNAAEGEPGSFKDRAILLRNPYLVLEGALIAAHAVQANEVVVALSHQRAIVRGRLDQAIEEVRATGWLAGVDLRVFEGPGEYLYGEETAMLEAIDGRPPFPRIAPPYRRGVHEIGSLSASAVGVQLASPSAGAVGSPALVNNVETLANIPAIVVEGPDWFRSIGTSESPGSVVCTVSGATRHHGVGEVAMGTPLREVIELIGGGPEEGRAIKAVIGGAATPILTADEMDTPVSHEGMQEVGGILGCGGFIVFDDRCDMASVGEAMARFLSIESCGMCLPCKEDGMALAELFGRVRRSQADESDLIALREHLETVTSGARCHLASQYQLVLQSVLDKFMDEIDDHVHGDAAPAEPQFIASIVDITRGVAVLDESHRHKQPDWTFEGRWSKKLPVDRLSTVGTAR